MLIKVRKRSVCGWSAGSAVVLRALADLSIVMTALLWFACFMPLPAISAQGASAQYTSVRSTGSSSAVVPGAPQVLATGSTADSASKCEHPHLISLPEIVKMTMAIYFGDQILGNRTLEQYVDEIPVQTQFSKPAGLFVTLSYNGKTRACWGSVYPEADSIKKATVYSTISALTKEYRYPPIRRAEWKRLKSQVTVVKNIEPIGSASLLNPLRDGLLVRAGGKGGVILPGEAVDAHYQMVMCKLKAGIKSGEPCQLYRLRTEIYD